MPVSGFTLSNITCCNSMERRASFSEVWLGYIIQSWSVKHCSKLKVEVANQKVLIYLASNNLLVMTAIKTNPISVAGWLLFKMQMSWVGDLNISFSCNSAPGRRWEHSNKPARDPNWVGQPSCRQLSLWMPLMSRCLMSRWITCSCFQLSRFGAA